MDKKNIKQKRTFVPQSIGDTLRKVNRKFTSKYNRTEFVINSKWPEIAGSYFKEYSEPLNVSRVRDFENDLGSRRTIIYTLDFELRTSFYGSIPSTKIIR